MTQLAQENPASPESTQIEPLDPYAHLRAFLFSKGVARHKQTAEIAGLLGLAKTSVFRKFKGDSAFTLLELKTIAEHFASDVDTLLGSGVPENASKASTISALEPARVNMNGRSLNALLTVGAALKPEDVCDLVALKINHSWEIFAQNDPELKSHTSQTHYSIESLQMSAAPYPCVALLEDDATAAAVLSMALQNEGMVVHTYTHAQALISAIAQRTYQGYVIDWLLGDDTAAGAIQAIGRLATQAPIAITTGALNTGVETEGSLIPFAERVGAGIFEKPFRHAVLASYLRRSMTKVHRQ
jgi:CheY-like chemotaxis protein